MDSSNLFSQSPSSQSRNFPQIFVDATGTPLSIFVESNGISDNRPKLIKTLRNHGASICADVSIARIILVEPDTSEGRHFVRDWGMDPGKVILEVAWVRRCLEDGRALLEHDAWGGCGNLDGTPLEDEPVDEEEPGLFTNSNAVVLNGRPSSSSSKSAPPRNSTASSLPGGRRTSILPTPRTSPGDYNQANSNTQPVQDLGAPSSQRLPTPPSSTSGPMPLPMPSTQFPQNMPPNMPSNGMPPYGQLVPQAAFPVNALDPQLMQAFTMMNNPEAMNLFMMMMQGMHPNGAIMRPAWQGQPPQGFTQILPGFQMFQQMQPLQPFPTPPQDMNGQSENAPPATRDPSPPEKTEPRRSMSPLPLITAVDESDSDSPPPRQSILKQRGKKRARDSAGPYSSKPAKRSKSPSASRDKRREKKRSSLSIEHTSSSPSTVKRDRSPLAGIFTAKDRSPMTFFVQVQMRNRQTVIKQIRSNGGKIVFGPSDADFILLDTSPGKERDTWLKSVKESKRFALRPGFVEACINSRGLVEEEDFVIEMGKTGKNGKKSSSSSRKKRQVTVESEDSFPTEQSSKDRTSTSRTPSPPAICQIPSTSRRSLFTKEDLEYSATFARHFLRKHPEATNSAIATELAKRAPSHPIGSWTGAFYGERREEMDRIRQELSEEKRKRSSNKTFSGSEPEVEAQLYQPSETSTARGATDASNELPQRLKEEQSRLLDADLKTIVDFFAVAEPPENVTDDGALWAAITREYECRTARSWQDFYEANQEIVNQRLREALNMPPVNTNGTQ